MPRRPPHHVVDVAIAAVLTLMGLLSLAPVDRLSDVDRPVDGLAAALVVVVGLGTAFRRSHPVPAAVVVAASTATYLAVGYPYGPIMFCLALTIYSLARETDLVPAAAWAGLALAAMLVHLVTNDAALSGPEGLAPASAWVAIPFTLGAARRLVVEAGIRERAEADRRLIDAERLRLAGEVHDVVGHGLAAIQMQADIALHVGDRRPEQADLALEAISRASAEALTELRTALAEFAPSTVEATPGLARLEALLGRVRAAGVDVDLQVVGEARVLPAAVDLAAYRILQEALTNVVKHSADPRAEVVVTHRPDAIDLTVTNPHLGDGRYAEGFGLTGMRSRVATLGGSLEAGRGTGPDRFVVRATLPTGGTT